MTSWRTLLVATAISAVLAACSEKAKPKPSDDDEDDEPRSKKTQSSASESSSAEASEDGDKPKDKDKAKIADKAPEDAPKDSITLDDGKHKVSVLIKPDGKTKLAVFDAKGKSIDAGEVKGTITPEGGEAATVKADDGALVAELPELEEGLTTIELALKIGDEKFEETLDVPKEGTAALAKVPKKSFPPGTKGPNGGTVEVVGDHIVELVIDKKTNDIRVYFLNDKLEQIEVPEGTEIELNIDDAGKVQKAEPKKK